MLDIDILCALSAFRRKEEGTYDLLTQQAVMYPCGFQVSFVRQEAYEQLSNEDWNTLTEYYSNHLESKPHIGVYNGDPEISFHAMDQMKAEETMECFNQESIFDWKAKNDYPNDEDRWFILNLNFDQNKVVDYHEILKQIQ